jgi:phosphatidylglycerol---prolipoprotein diacylglyceryl transferase
MFPLLQFGSIQIPTFFLVISLSLSFLLIWFSTTIDHQSEPMNNRKIAFDLVILLLVGGLLGARFFHVFYEEAPYYRSYPAEIFKLWNGGFTYYGGLIAAVPLTLLYCYLKRVSFLRWADLFTPFVSVAYALGRVGCFLEGCCYGKYCQLPWAINNRHPTQIYMILGELITLALVLFVLKRPLRKFHGHIFFAWLSLHALSRFIIEYFRDDPRGAQLSGLYVSQVFSLVVIAAAITFFSMQKRSRRPH